MAELFFKYQTKECTELEHDLVYHYMINHSIEELMESKMNEKELFLGSIAPDISKQIGESKVKSHFLNTSDSDVPNVFDFLEKCI